MGRLRAHSSRNSGRESGRRIGAYALAAVLLGISGIAGADASNVPRISVDVDRTPIVEGEPFTLSIVVETSSRGEPEIRLPSLGRFQVLSQSESHPMSFSFSFGFGTGSQAKSRRQSSYTFVLSAPRAGKYELDPIQVTLDGRKFQGEPYLIDVQRGSGQPQATPDSTDEPGKPAEPAVVIQMERGKIEGAKYDADFFIQTALSTKKAYVGEMVVMTVYIYTSVNLSDVNVAREPGTEGFWAENLVPASQRLSTEPVTIGRYVFDRAVLRKVALFPIEPGSFTIAPPLVEIEVSRGGFFSQRRVAKRSGVPVQIEVAKLPVQDQPAGFDPANVGVFSFSAELDNAAVKANEPVTLTMTAQGVGNVRNLVLPSVPEIPGLKAFAPDSNVTVQTEGGEIAGSKSSKVVMIPKAAGQYVVPEISWSYFDPKLGQYKTVTVPPKKITVAAGTGDGSVPSKAAEGEAKGPPDKGEERLNKQLNTIVSKTSLRIGGDRSPLSQGWFLGLAFGMPLLYFGLMAVSLARQRAVEGREKARPKRAESVALRRLSKLRGQLEVSSEEFFKELGGLLVGFLEDRLEAPVAGDTMTEIKGRLMARGFSNSQADAVVIEMESSDFARFARSAGSEAERLQALARMEQLVKELAKVRVTPLPGGKA